MVAANPSAPSPARRECLHAAFVALLPRIEQTARISFRHIGCPDRRADAVAETVAVAWHWYRRCADRGNDAGAFVGTLARLAARHVGGGRGLCGQLRATDALSPRAQRRHGFTVAPLPTGSGTAGTAWDEALHENTRSPVPDQVCFRLDFPRWLRRLAARDRRVARELMAGERAADVARKFGLTKGRVSQLRRAFRRDWEAFGGDGD
jgi:hypothetical protein